MKKKDYIFENIKILKGVGKNTARYLRNKKVDTIRDLLLDFPVFKMLFVLSLCSLLLRMEATQILKHALKF